MPENHYFSYIRPDTDRASPTYEAGDKAKLLSSQCSDAINLTLGELDISPTDAMLAQWKTEAAALASQNPLYRLSEAGGKSRNYPPAVGTAEFRAVAADHFTKETGIEGVTAKDIIAHSGGKGVLNLVGRQFKRGDKVLVAGPGWPSNYDIWRDGVEIIEVDTKGRGLMSPEQIRQALADHPDAKALLVNDPCNPTGARYTPEEREAVMEALCKHHKTNASFLTIADDPYGALTYGGATMQRGANEAALFQAGAMAVVNSISKIFARPDQRVGWLITKNKALLENIPKSITTVGQIPEAQQNNARLLLLFGKEFIEETSKRLEARAEKLASTINKIPGLHMEKPQGAIYGWINTEGLKGKKVPAEATLSKQGFTIKTPADVANFFREVAHVGTVDGSPFYAEGSPAAQEKGWFVRMVLSDEKILEQACSQISAAVEKLQSQWAGRDYRPPSAPPGWPPQHTHRPAGRG